jgi:hypothetical protein
LAQWLLSETAISAETANLSRCRSAVMVGAADAKLGAW